MWWAAFPTQRAARCCTQAELPKPSEGIEYTYARKPAAYDHEKKDLAHIWEVGGSHEFAEELVNSDQLFLTAKQVRRSTSRNNTCYTMHVLCRSWCAPWHAAA